MLQGGRGKDLYQIFQRDEGEFSGRVETVTYIEIGNWTRYLNHCCKTYNCVVRKFVWRGMERMLLQVREGYEIKLMDELCINYGDSYVSAKGKEWCQCRDCVVG